VRATALTALQNMNTCEDTATIEGLLSDPSDDVRRAAVGLLLACGRDPVGVARRLLDGNDDALRRHVIDALFERPYPAGGAPDAEWIEHRATSQSPEDRRLAAQALGVLSFRAPAQRLRELIGDSDPEVRRAALRSAARRPSRELLDVLVPLLAVPDLSYESREAVAAIGDAAIPALRQMLDARRCPTGMLLRARWRGSPRRGRSRR
jgi:HEAT repeat protein